MRAMPATFLTLAALLASCGPQPADRHPDLPGDPARGYRIASGTCASCHGIEGNPAGSAIPKLAGQFPDYLVKQLKAFAAGQQGKAGRIAPVMGPIATALSPADIDDVASWYAQQYRSEGQPRDAGRVAEGHQLFLHGDPANGLPACASCHRPSGSGIRPDFPNLAAQDPAYVEQQLTVWEQTRGHPGKLMSMIVPHIAASQRAPLADYIASLPPVETPPEGR